MNKFIEALYVLAPYYPRGLEQEFFIQAEHDIIYFHVSSDQISEESTEGLKLIELGLHYDESVGCWAKFT